MSIIDPNQLSRRESYAAMTRCVVPRPIGWTSTVDADGNSNLAPFSFFGGVTSDPFIVMLSVGRRRGEQKDTTRNLLATREAVIHIAGEPLAQAMVATSAEVGPEIDEFELAGLSKADCECVKVPRVKEAALAFEALLHGPQEVGNGPVDVFFLEVVRIHIAADIEAEDGLPDANKLRAVARLGGPDYAIAAPTFSVDRPR